jgi:hypothetical protein
MAKPKITYVEDDKPVTISVKLPAADWVFAKTRRRVYQPSAAMVEISG